MSLVNCPECGSKISISSRKCINCGYPLNKKRHRLYSILLLTVVLLVLLVIFIVFSQKKSSKIIGTWAIVREDELNIGSRLSFHRDKTVEITNSTDSDIIANWSISADKINIIYENGTTISLSYSINKNFLTLTLKVLGYGTTNLYERVSN